MDSSFCDTTHMVHYVIKSFKNCKVKELAGEANSMVIPHSLTCSKQVGGFLPN